MRRLIIASCVLVGIITLYNLVAQAQQNDARIEFAAVFPDNSFLIHVSVPEAVQTAELVVGQAPLDLEATAISQVRWLLLDGSDGMLNLQPAVQTAIEHLLDDSSDSATGIVVYNSTLAVLPPTNDVDALQQFLSTHTATANEPACLWDALSAVKEFEREMDQGQRVLVVTSGLSSQDDCTQRRAPDTNFPVDIIVIAEPVDEALQRFSTLAGGNLLTANLRTLDRQVQEITAIWAHPIFMLMGTLDEPFVDEATLNLTLSNDETVSLPLVFAAASFPEGLETATPTVTATATEVLATLPPVPTNTPSPTITQTSSVTPSRTPTNTATATFTATPTETFTSTPTITPTATATDTATATFTATATYTWTPTPTETFTSTPTPTPTDEPTEVAIVIVPTSPPEPTPSPTPIPDAFTSIVNSISGVNPLLLGGIALVVIGVGMVVLITRPRGVVAQPRQRTTSFYENLDTQIGNRATFVASPPKIEDEETLVTAALPDEQLRVMSEELPEPAEGVIAWVRLNTAVPQYFELRAEGATIGRSKECQINIKGDLFVSRQHAHLRVDEGKVYIEKTSARNPVLVNNVPVVDPHLLRSYDVIQLSPSTQLIFIATQRRQSHD